MYIYAAILIAGLIGGFTGAWQVQNWRHGAEQTAQAREERAREETRKAAQEGAAEAIAALKPINTTIVQKVQREIQKERIYQDCRLTPEGLKLANEALVGPSGQKADPAGVAHIPSEAKPRDAVPTP